MTGTAADATAGAYAKKLVTHDGLTSGDIPNDLSVRLAHNPEFAKNLEQALVQFQSGSGAAGLNQKEITAILNECTIYDGTHQPGSFKGETFDLPKGGPDGANASNFIQVYSDGSSLGIHALPDAQGRMTITGLNTTEVDPQTQQVTNHQFRLSPGDPPGTLVAVGKDGNPVPNAPKLYDAHVDCGGKPDTDSAVVVFRTGPDANAQWAQFNPVTGKLEAHQATPNDGAGTPGARVPGAPGPDGGAPAPGAPGPDAGAPPAVDQYQFSGPAAPAPEAGALGALGDAGAAAPGAAAPGAAAPGALGDAGAAAPGASAPGALGDAGAAAPGASAPGALGDAGAPAPGASAPGALGDAGAPAPGAAAPGALGDAGAPAPGAAAPGALGDVGAPAPGAATPGALGDAGAPDPGSPTPDASNPPQGDPNAPPAGAPSAAG
jgi:hypothetical protein